MELLILNGYSGVVHNGTKLCNDGVGERYRLSCGREVYVGMIKTTYVVIHLDDVRDATVLCKTCLRNRKAAQAEAQ